MVNVEGRGPIPQSAAVCRHRNVNTATDVVLKQLIYGLRVVYE